MTGSSSSARCPTRSCPAIYRGALALVFPSLYEGFGLPPLEAMACGTPVVSSAATSLAEVVGDAALVIDPLDVDSIADGIDKVVDDDCPSRGPTRARVGTSLPLLVGADRRDHLARTPPPASTKLETPVRCVHSRSS